MLWRTHALAGIASLWLVQPLANNLADINFGLLCALAALGALLPDLDASESKVKYLSAGGIQPFAPMAVMLHRDYGHRGLLHSPRGLVLVGIAAMPLTLWLGWQPLLALWLGYASHLVLDACTKSGIPGWSVHGKRVHLLPPRLRFVTGSSAEEAVTALLGIIVLTLLLQHLFLTASP